ncbi:MAG: protein kinase [Myxococcota bacterium]
MESTTTVSLTSSTGAETVETWEQTRREALVPHRSPAPRSPDAAVMLANVEEQLFGANPPKRPTLGRFQLLRRLGSGAMGVVYEAYDPDLDRRCALKVLRPDVAARRGLHARSRMLREAQALACLRHPHVTMVYEVGRANDDVLFIAMELVEGRTVKRWLRARPRSWREIVEVFTQAGRGLAAAHHAGLVHRDFKPDNVLIDEQGQARVVDFGLARSTGMGEFLPTLDDDGTSVGVDLTCTGAVLGTPAYMAPEQFDGGSVRPTSDQFSFCVALFEALYGRRPYPGNDLPSLQRSLVRGRVVGPRRGVPTRLYRVLKKGLSIESHSRFRDMEELLGALEACLRRSAPWRSMTLLAGLAVAGVVGALSPGESAPVAEPPPVAAQCTDDPAPDRALPPEPRWAARSAATP